MKKFTSNQYGFGCSYKYAIIVNCPVVSFITASNYSSSLRNPSAINNPTITT